MDIFDLTGPAFLNLFGCAMFIFFGAALALRMLCQISEAQEVYPEDLNVYDAAYLSGGASTAISAAVTSLMHRDALVISPSEDAIAVRPLNDELHPLERCIIGALAGKSKQDAAWACKHSVPAADLLHEKLRNLGLVASRGKSVFVRTFGTLLLLSPILLFGLPKILIGLSRHRPVGFLVLMCLLAALVTWLFYSSQILRTFQGDKLLKNMQFEYAALRTSASSGSLLSGAEVAMLLSLFGSGTIMALPAFAASCELVGTPRSNIGKSGCGSGGCGGGGCGGGGCGGCGG